MLSSLDSFRKTIGTLDIQWFLKEYFYLYFVLTAVPGIKIIRYLPANLQVDGTRCICKIKAAREFFKPALCDHTITPHLPFTPK